MRLFAASLPAVPLFDTTRDRMGEYLWKHWAKQERKYKKTGPHPKYKCHDARCLWHHKDAS